MKKLILAVLLVVTFLISALVHLPVQVVLNYLPLPPQLSLTAASGTLWQGQVQQLKWQRYNFGQVSWQLQPSKLFSGKVQASVRLGRGNPWQLRARGVVGYGFSGAYAQTVIASMPAKEVLKFAPRLPVPIDISGQLELSIASLQYAAPYCQSGQGNLVWNTDKIGTPLAELEVGPVVADFACDNSQIKVVGKQQSEQVQSGFNLDLMSNRSYTTTAWFKPQAEMPSEFTQQLKWLSQPDNQGRYQFTYRGRI